MEDYKIKPLTKDQLLISLDRITRFKETEIKYLRVYKDILIHNLIIPKYNKSELDLMEYKQLTKYASCVINDSIKELGLHKENSFIINKKLKEYEYSVFKISDEASYLLDNDINYDACISLIEDNSVKNLLWLRELYFENMQKIRHDKSLLFPIEKVVIAEGATEETLLPEFGRLCDYDFSKEGLYIISAGGKNQVVRMYYELSDILNLPIFVLLDRDGLQSSREITQKLRPKDSIYVLESGEFEDLLPLSLVERTLNYELKNIAVIDKNLADKTMPRTKYLEEVFKNRGLHEFKKVEFAHMIKRNLKSSKDLSAEIIQIIQQIREMDKTK